jgi:hypothetical protein
VILLEAIAQDAVFPVFPTSRSVSMQKKEIVTAIFVILEIAAIGSRK